MGKEMNGTDWAIIIIVAILAVILSTISSWWSQLVFTLGFRIALIVVAIIIVTLVVALIALMVADPGWLDRTFGTLTRNMDKLTDVAVRQTGRLMRESGGALADFLKASLTPLLILGSGYLVYRILKDDSDSKGSTYDE